MGTKMTIAAAVIAFMASALAAKLFRDSNTPATAASEHQPVRAAADVSYASMLDSVDERIDALQPRVNDRHNDWLIRMHLGILLLERASLTNQLEDFERLEELLDEAFLIAPEGSGPLLLAARFNFSIHRLEAAEEYLEKIDGYAVPRRDEMLAAQVIRAEIAFQRGEYEAALEGLTAVAAVMPAVTTAELALYHAKTGEPEKAEELLAEALASTLRKDPRRRAWLRLQLGLIALDRGANLPALEQLEAADAELPGWWLVQEHIAEVHERLGDHEKALEIYAGLVETTGLPQHLDALASAYQHAGEQAKAKELSERAGVLWEEQIGRLPEAAMGHGLQHYLQFGPTERAVELAEKNYAVRPGGEAQVLLARAYLKAGRAAEALEVAKKTLETPYRTAGVHDVAAKAYEAVGDAAAAAEQSALRDAINPSYQGKEHSH